MQHAANTSAQARTLLRALRQSRGLTQGQLGALLGLSQKRVARIEADPGVTGFDQITRLVVALGGRLLVDDGAAPAVAAPTASRPPKAKSAARQPSPLPRTATVRGTW